MCGLFWTTPNLGYLPDRYIILLSYFAASLCLLDCRNTSYVLFFLWKSILRLNVGQMCVHHMCLSEWLLSRYYVNPANNLYVFYFGELINISVMFQFNTVLRLQLQRVCELRPTTSLGSGRGSGSTRATTEGTTSGRTPLSRGTPSLMSLGPSLFLSLLSSRICVTMTFKSQIMRRMKAQSQIMRTR